MIIKCFIAESAAAALKKVRQEMGGEALVLKTRKLVGPRGDERIEITACLEKPTAAQSSEIFPDVNEPFEETQTVPSLMEPELPASIESAEINLPSIEQRLVSVESKLDKLLDFGLLAPTDLPTEGERHPLTVTLRDADLPEDFISSFIDRLSQYEEGDEELIEVAHRQLVGDLSQIMLPDLEFAKGDRVLFIGPAGAGKSSAMGKIAAHLAGNKKRKVELATIDTIKLGAHDEIHGYADFLGLEVIDGNDDDEEEKSKKDRIILIDSPAWPSPSFDLKSLADQIERIQPTHRIAVFSCLTRSIDLIQMISQIRGLNPTHIIMTMLDLTERHGAMVAAAHAAGCKIAFVTDRPGGFGTVMAPDPNRVAQRLLQITPDSEKAEV